jgi:NADH-quinone oxidoreductase subunit M
MLLSGIMLKMGLYSIIRWQPYRSLAAKSTCISLGIAGVIYGSILALRKRLKEVTRLLFISPRWVNCSRTYTLTIDGLRGAYK